MNVFHTKNSSFKNCSLEVLWGTDPKLFFYMIFWSLDMAFPLMKVYDSPNLNVNQEPLSSNEWDSKEETMTKSRFQRSIEIHLIPSPEAGKVLCHKNFPEISTKGQLQSQHKHHTKRNNRNNRERRSEIESFRRTEPTFHKSLRNTAVSKPRERCDSSLCLYKPPSPIAAE